MTDRPAVPLNDEALERYSRHLLLTGFTEPHQRRLGEASVLVVGAGGLGGPASLYLAASGVGRLVVADGDRVELSNLQRQVVHSEASIGVNKAASAGERLRAINSTIVVETLEERLAGERLAGLIVDCDLVVDASDDFPTRYAINRLCRRHRRPHVFGACIGWRGQIAVFDHGPGTPCLECLFSEADEPAAGNCHSLGVFSPLTGVVGSLMAAEAVRGLAGLGPSAPGRLLCLDLGQADWRWLRIVPDEACRVCGRVKADASGADRGYNRAAGR